MALKWGHEVDTDGEVVAASTEYVNNDGEGRWRRCLEEMEQGRKEKARCLDEEWAHVAVTLAMARGGPQYVDADRVSDVVAPMAQGWVEVVVAEVLLVRAEVRRTTR